MKKTVRHTEFNKTMRALKDTNGFNFDSSSRLVEFVE